MPTQSMKEQFQSPASLLSMKDPNASLIYGSLTSPMLEPQPQYIQPSVVYQRPASYGYMSYMSYIYPAVQQQAMPTPNQTLFCTSGAQVAHNYSAELPTSKSRCQHLILLHLRPLNHFTQPIPKFNYNIY
ncbi:hypothetical protein ACFX13_044601 [Malus domestica]